MFGGVCFTVNGNMCCGVAERDLVLRLGNPDFTGDLEHWHGNTFRVTWRYHFYGTAYATFDVDALGRPQRLSLARTGLHYERVAASTGAGSRQ